MSFWQGHVIQIIVTLFSALLFQIVVQVRDEGNGWIVGRTGSVEGAFPASYVEKLSNNGPDQLEVS